MVAVIPGEDTEDTMEADMHDFTRKIRFFICTHKW